MSFKDALAASLAARGTKTPATISDDSVLVINDWGEVTASLRTRKGKERVSIEIRGEPLIIQTDPTKLGKPVALALEIETRRGVATYSRPVKPSTERARGVAKRAFERGETWARKRYGGGRIGPMAPDTTSRWLNDSGRLARSVQMRPTNAGTYVMNVAANRLTIPDVRAVVLPILHTIIRAAMASKAVAEGVAIAKGLVVQKRRNQFGDLLGKLKETLGAAQGLGNAAGQFDEEPAEEGR